MISLIAKDKGRIGYFKSYKAIGEYLANHGETGKYYAIPKNIKSIAGIKEIYVKQYEMAEEDGGGIGREIEMEGSCY